MKAWLGSASRRRLLTVAAVVLVVAMVPAGAALGVLGGGSQGAASNEGTIEAPEPVLGGADAVARAGETRSRPERLEPREDAAADVEETAEEEPPARILRENAKLRGELEHLEKLEAERRSVSGTLARAAEFYNGPLRLGAGGLAWPVQGPVVSPFGQRWGRLHAGIDIAVPAGTVIRAAQTGRVAISAPTGGYGNYVCVQHTARLNTCYAHLSQFLTTRGAPVRQGQPIGLVGCTGHCFGDHLHFETWVDETPVDPMGYL